MTRRALLILLCITSTVLIACANAASQSYMVKMRDGVQLYTVVILNSTSPLPVVLLRTPYGTANAESTQAYYVALGYNTVSQDFRGRYGSQGDFDFWAHSSPDAYDTMQWIVDQSWSNKDIYAQGGSALGVACYLQAEAQPPWLKAQFVIFGTGELHKTSYQGGAYRQSLISGWLAGIGEANYTSTILANEAYDAYWEPTNDQLYWQDIKWPAVHATGWYDIFLQQQLDAYTAYRNASTAPYKDFNFLVVGAGGHCAGGGQVQWPNSSLVDVISVYISDLLFAATRGDTKAEEKMNADLTYIYYYVLGPELAEGEIGNYWTNANTFPIPKYTKLYLSSDGVLDTQPPSIASNATYVYNPADPVPTYGGNNLLLPQCGPWNQSKLETRSDVISFTTAAFTDAVAITGHVYATLYVSSNATDTDFTVKYTDVYPDGTTSMLIQDGIIRMRWRENNTTPSPMVPGEVYSIVVDLWSTSYIFNKGHALRVSISSSNYPRFSANYNNGQPLSDPGEPLIAENTIYFSTAYPSFLELPVVPVPPPMAI